MSALADSQASTPDIFEQDSNEHAARVHENEGVGRSNFWPTRASSILVTAPYRSHEEALRAKRAELAKDLSRVRGELAAIDAVDSRARAIESELARDAKKDPRSLPLLDRVRVASPCTASWDDMVGDERSRFCGACGKNVYDLSAMARDEAERFVREAEGGACVRLARRADGRVVSNDCPVGAKKKRVRLAVLGAVGAALVGCAAVAGADRIRAAITGAPAPGHVVMGEMKIAPPEPGEPGEPSGPSGEGR